MFKMTYQRDKKGKKCDVGASAFSEWSLTPDKVCYSASFCVYSHWMVLLPFFVGLLLHSLFKQDVSPTSASLYYSKRNMSDVLSVLSVCWFEQQCLTIHNLVNLVYLISMLYGLCMNKYTVYSRNVQCVILQCDVTHHRC